MIGKIEKLSTCFKISDPNKYCLVAIICNTSIVLWLIWVCVYWIGEEQYNLYYKLIGWPQT